MENEDRDIHVQDVYALHRDQVKHGAPKVLSDSKIKLPIVYTKHDIEANIQH